MAKTGYFETPTGLAIVGTVEVMEGCAQTIGIEQQPDGTYTPVYEGYTEVYWDSQRSKLRHGQLLYIDEDGVEWTADQLVFIPAALT